MAGMAILLGYNLAGMWIKQLLHLPVPGNIIGLIMLTASLYSGIIKLAWVEAAAQFLTKHMLLFFIPFVVGILSFLPLIGANFISIVFSLIVSTFVTLAVTGWITTSMMKRTDGSGKKAASGEAGDPHGA